MNQSSIEEKNILTNRRARHEYFIEESLEAGIALKGTEVKSVREGKVNFQDAYATVENGELWLLNLHISPFEKGNIHNHDPIRKRKLLVTRREIRKLGEKVNIKGMTLIPLRLYLKGRYVKVEIGVCKGKKFYDKRDTLKKRDIQRDIDRHT
jgi:SsrA-binding protein